MNQGGFFMFNFMVNSDGGLTTAGYAVCVVAVIVLFFAAVLLIPKKSKAKPVSAKQLVFCAAAMALAYLTSYLKLFELPFGGTVTLFSMLFITLIGYWYGVKAGIMTGLAFGILQFLQEPYALSFFQVCCDYFLAFAALGLSGVFREAKHGLQKGYILAVLARGVFHSLGGYLFWMSYMPENFPKSLAMFYPIIYNYSYLLAEGILTLIVISVPAVQNALARVKILATE